MAGLPSGIIYKGDVATVMPDSLCSTVFACFQRGEQGIANSTNATATTTRLPATTALCLLTAGPIALAWATSRAYPTCCACPTASTCSPPFIFLPQYLSSAPPFKL